MFPPMTPLTERVRNESENQQIANRAVEYTRIPRITFDIHKWVTGWRRNFNPPVNPRQTNTMAQVRR